MNYGGRTWDVGQLYREQDTRRRVPMRALLGIPGDELAAPTPVVPNEMKYSNQDLAYTGNPYLEAMARGQFRDRTFAAVEPGPRPTLSETIGQTIQGDKGGSTYGDTIRGRIAPVLETISRFSPGQGMEDVIRSTTGESATPLSVSAMGVLPGGRLAGKAIPRVAEALPQLASRYAARQPVAGTVGDPGNAGVIFEGMSPAQFSPGQWGRFGEQYGVPNLGPKSDEAFAASLQPVTGRSGQTYTVPGGIEGKDPFTYYDELYLKAQGINPNDLTPAQHQAIHDRFVASKAPTGPLSDERIFNQLSMGMISPNQPLTANELAVARIMAKGPEDIERVAGMVPWRYDNPVGARDVVGTKISGGKESPITRRQQTSSQIASQLGLQAQSKGGIGAVGSADYTRIAEMAQMMRDRPDFFRFRGAAEGGANPSEHWANFVQRTMNQVPGLSAKTGSFATVWQDPSKAAISAIDRHMARKFNLDMFPTKAEGQEFADTLIKSYNKERGASVKSFDELLSAPGGRGMADEALFGYLNRHPEMQYRVKKTGEINPQVPESLRDVDWVTPPTGKVQTISDPYKRTLAANAAEAEKAGQGVFSNQWLLWDRIRNRLEPHEVMYPGLEKLPRMSMPQMQAARDAHANAGYMLNVGAVNPTANPSSLAHFAAMAGISIPALMALYQDEGR